MKHLTFGILFIIVTFLGGSVSARNCPGDPLPVSQALHQALNHAEDELEKAHHQKALHILAEYTHANPAETHPQLPFLKGLVYYGLKRFADSEIYFKQAIKQDPCFGEAWQNLAAVHERQNRPAQAAETITRAFSLIQPENPELLFQAALFWLSAKETKKAISILKQLCARPNPSPPWRTSLAHVLETLEKNHNAAKALARRKAAGEASAERFRSALIHLKNGAPEKALPLLEAISKRANPEPQWLLALAATLDKLNRAEEAVAVMKKVNTKSPALSANMRLQVAIFWLKHDHPKRALPLLNRIPRNPHTSKSFRLAQIEALVRTGQAQAAHVPLKTLLDQYPQDEKIWRLAAWTAIEQKSYGKAAAALEVAFLLKTPKSRDLKKLGNLYRLAGVPRKAAQTYVRAFGKDPTANDLDLLAGTHGDAHQIKEALAAATRAAKLAPTAKRLSRLGRMHMELRDCRKGMDAFQQAAQLDDPKGVNSLHAGYAAWKLDQFTFAKTAFQSVLQKADSGSPNARRASKALKAIEQTMKQQQRAGTN